MSINNNFMSEAGVAKTLLAATAKATVNILLKNHSTDTDAEVTVRRVLAKDVGISTLAITNEGSAYVTMPTIAIAAPTVGDTATADARIGINAIAAFGSAGTGYSVNDVLSFTDGGNAVEAGTITVTDVDGSGVIQSATVTTPGNYNSFPTQPMAATGGDGNGATVQFTFKVVGAEITDAGSGYATAPTVTIDGTATGDATLGANEADYQKIEDATALVAGASIYWKAIAVQPGDIITVHSDTATVSANAWGIDGL